MRSVFGEMHFDQIIEWLGIDLTKAFAAADYGAGAGFLTLKLAELKKCRIVYSLDNNEMFIEDTVKIAKKNDILHKIEFIDTDLAKDLKMKNDSVDYAFCNYLLSYNDDNSVFNILNGISKVLNKGGGFYISEFINLSAVRKFEVPHARTIEQMIALIERTNSYNIEKKYLKKFTQAYFIRKI